MPQIRTLYSGSGSPVGSESKLTRKERQAYASAMKVAAKVAAKYDCEHCELADYCNEGEKCRKYKSDGKPYAKEYVLKEKKRRKRDEK